MWSCLKDIYATGGGGGGGREGQFSPQIPLLRGLFVPWGFSAPETTEVEGIKSTSVVSHLQI